MSDAGASMKNVDHKDPNKVLDTIGRLKNLIDQPEFDLEQRQDIKINIRVDEKIAPAKFKADPLIPGGYIANSLTIKAMRADIFVLGNSIEELSADYHCPCGQTFDVQFWKLCPYCARKISM